MEPHEKLEGEIADWAGVRNVVACSSGTAALHLALESLRLPPGSPVIVPDFCMVAVPRAVAMAGLKPIFVDVDENGNLDPELTSKASREANVRAIIVVHTYGVRAQVEAIADVADRDGIPFIEDLAEAHGVRPHRDATAACWSFYRNKIVAGEEGGAVAFEVPRLAARARQLRCLGFTAAHDFSHQPRGWNHRLAPSLAEKVSASLAKFGCHVKERWECWRRWRDFGTPPGCVVFEPQAPWVYALRLPVEAEVARNALVKDLRDISGIEARHGFRPCHQQAEWAGSRLVAELGATPMSVRLSRSLFYLPLTEELPRTTSANRVRDRIAKAIEEARAAATAST